MNAAELPIARFRLGKIVATANALQQLTPEDILAGIQRHQAGDWGELGSADSQANERSLRQGLRLSSLYRAGNGQKFWLITEANRSVTSVLLPEDS